jgi:hypothetical protein
MTQPTGDVLIPVLFQKPIAVAQSPIESLIGENRAKSIQAAIRHQLKYPHFCFNCESEPSKVRLVVTL